MYNFMVDIVREIVFIELSGSLSIEQIKEYVNDIHQLTLKFESKRYSMLILANRLDPISQYAIPHFRKAIEKALAWANKIAVVNGNRTITLIQMKRIEAEARAIIHSDTKIMRFKTKKEALIYLCRD